MHRFVVLLSIGVAVLSAMQYDFPLQRMARASQSNSALLVPYPRVGKRSETNSAATESLPHLGDMEKRLFVARVGKRAFMYAARVGK